ncbi:MAG: hypothetical protein KAS78_01285 [Candidatus Pacebacteria bacterium]|nr:hypothetical protein [Candidatus Paceibacterota bacterium]
MHKVNPQSLISQSLFGVSLEKLIPKDHPKKIILDKLPWDELVKISRKAYKSDYWKDKPNVRVMIGLFIWHCISGDKTYREISDDFNLNNLCAYACGFKEIGFRTIDNSTLVKFEEHLGEENILAIKDIIEKIAVTNQPPNSKGRYSGDTTVFESNVTFPTDTKVMESVRLFLVNDIIKKYQGQVYQNHRTYTLLARKEYLGFAKKRIINKKQVKKIKKKQLQFLRRNILQAEQVIMGLETKSSNLKNVNENLFEKGTIKLQTIKLLGKADKKAFKKLKAKLGIAKQIYSQQMDWYKGKKIENRIINFHRPSVRPIFRGKAQKKTEFGIKTFCSIMGKALILSKTSYSNFYDGKGFKESISDMKKKKYLVKEVVGDKGNGGMCLFLKDNNIIDGIEKRGKRKKDPPIPKKRFARSRNKMEGAFGVIKNVFIKNRLRAKTDGGDIRKIAKAMIGYNLKYAL